MSLRRFLLRRFHDIAFAAIFATLIVPASVFAAERPDPRNSDGRCVDVVQPNLAMLDEVLREAGDVSSPALRITDDRFSVSVTLTPRFNGPRPFDEPSGISFAQSYAWNPAPMVTTFAPEAAPIVYTDHSLGSMTAKRTDPLFLGAHWMRGAGKRTVAIVVDATVAKWTRWGTDPRGAAFDVWCSPMNPVCFAGRATYGVYRAGQELPTTLPKAWRAIFDAPSYGESAEAIGERSVDVLLLLGPLSKGSGIAALDDFIAERTAPKLTSIVDYTTPTKLRIQMEAEEMTSIFHRDGTLVDEIVRDSEEIQNASELGNERVVEALTRDGSSITDWGKYETPSIASPAGEFRVHFYKNSITGEVNYAYDYKMKFTGVTGNPQIHLRGGN